MNFMMQYVNLMRNDPFEIGNFGLCCLIVTTGGGGGGGNIPFFLNIAYIFGTCHNFFPLSSVQIIIIPACCLLCLL